MKHLKHKKLKKKKKKHIPTQPYALGVGTVAGGSSYPARQTQPPSVEHWARSPQDSGLHGS